MKKLSLLALPFVLSLSAWGYTVNITTPAEGQGFLSPAQTVNIKVAVEPSLDPLHEVMIYLDDDIVGVGNTANIKTIGQNAGRHVITAELQNEKGQVLASDTRTVYFVLNSLIMREQRAAAKAKAEYDALPWYKKVIKKINPDPPKPKDDGFLTPATNLEAVSVPMEVVEMN